MGSPFLLGLPFLLPFFFPSPSFTCAFPLTHLIHDLIDLQEVKTDIFNIVHHYSYVDREDRKSLGRFMVGAMEERKERMKERRNKERKKERKNERMKERKKERKNERKKERKKE